MRVNLYANYNSPTTCALTARCSCERLFWSWIGRQTRQLGRLNLRRAGEGEPAVYIYQLSFLPNLLPFLLLPFPLLLPLLIFWLPTHLQYEHSFPPAAERPRGLWHAATKGIVNWKLSRMVSAPSRWYVQGR